MCVFSMSIGVASVVVMVSMGQGAQKHILDMIHDMGTNLIVVNAGQVTLVGGRERQAAVVTTLRPADVTAIAEQVVSVADAAPETSRRMNVRWESENMNTEIVGVTPAAFSIRKIEIKTGRIFNSFENDSAQRVAVIGSVIAEILFREENPVGHQIRIGLAPFEVVGVMTAKGLDATGVDRDDRILISLETFMRRLERTFYIQKIHIQVKSFDKLNSAEAEIKNLLRERHRLGDKPDDFTIQNQATIVETEKEATRTLTVLVGSIASISLLVGGIGILAVMLSAYRERRREIGLRRAVGARRHDIRMQFLLESLIFASLGGFLGAFVGILFTLLASGFGGWDIVISWVAIFLGFVLSAVGGLIFGIYPASKAARLEPIEALRCE